MRGATICSFAGLICALFQSTLPVRGATFGFDSRAAPKDISIHAPREGSDRALWAVESMGTISIHAPREGSDAPGGEDRQADAVFQSTLPVRGATQETGDRRPRSIISIHAPREGSDATACAVSRPTIISIHAPREGSDRRRRSCADGAERFQSTLPVRGATAEMHKIVVYFCKGCPVLGTRKGDFIDARDPLSTFPLFFPAKTGANLTGKTWVLGVRS